jgi:proton-translocating NADH-quinone oxidoreductase chain L
MEGDPHISRFMSYISLFTFGMLGLVTSDNFIQLFAFWEIIGVASFLLINFWFTRLQANKSAIKAMIMNRIGDVGLALGICLLYSYAHTTDFAVLFACSAEMANESFQFWGYECDLLTLACLLLLIGATGKSAQLGLHTWLPDAMEAPTPISALLHAATLVTAGVFLIARCSPLFEFAPTALTCTTFLGTATAFFAASMGVAQNDIKRVIAYSTCSQLGYMVFACGLSHYSVGIFHLMNHAFFKALLFLSAGAVIHAFSDEQDMRRMGGVAPLLPLTLTFFEIGSLALIGFPFLTGFYSKDVILEVAYARYELSGQMAHFWGSFAAFLTSYYSFRLLFLTFFGETRGFKNVIKKVHESSFFMIFPLIFLAFGSVYIGYSMKDQMIGLGTQFWGAAIFTLPGNELWVESEYIPQSIKMIPLLAGIYGAIIAGIMTIHPDHESAWFPYSAKVAYLTGNEMYWISNVRWFFDQVYNGYIGYPALKFGYQVSFKTLDKGLLEWVGPSGIITTVPLIVRKVSKVHSGYLYNHAFVILLGLTGLIALHSMVIVDVRLFILYPLILLF